MAAKSKKRKQNYRTLKEIDVNRWTKQAIEKRGISEKTLRKRYSEFRAVAVRRQKALIAKGYGKVPEVTANKFPTLAELDARADLDVNLYLKLKMKQLAEFINNPLTLVSKQGERSSYKAYKTLNEHGFNVKFKDMEAFGDFMDKLRARGLGLLLDSDRAAKYFAEHYRPDIPMEAFLDAFERYRKEDDTDKLENLISLYPKDEQWRSMAYSTIKGLNGSRLEELEKNIERRRKIRERYKDS